MCHRRQTGTKFNTKGGRKKKKKEALLIKQLVVHSRDVKKKKKNPLLHLSNRMTSNNVQQKHCRKLFTLKQKKRSFISKQNCSAQHSTAKLK